MANTMERLMDSFSIQINGHRTIEQFAQDEKLSSPKIMDKSLSMVRPLVVLLHGVMGSAANWRRVARDLSDQFTVFAYDSRGHGRSSHADLGERPLAYSPDGLAEDLDRLLMELSQRRDVGSLSQLALRPIILIGHSMGGRVAYTFAAKFPQRVCGLVIEDIGPRTGESGKSLVERVLKAVPVPFESKRMAQVWFAEEFPKLFADLPDARTLGAWLYTNIDDGAGWRFHVEGIRQAVATELWERWEEIVQLRAPTLLIRGERSNDLPREIFEKMLVANPRINGIEIPNAGHWVHSEQFEAFMGALRPFLNGLLHGIKA